MSILEPDLSDMWATVEHASSILRLVMIARTLAALARDVNRGKRQHRLAPHDVAGDSTVS